MMALRDDQVVNPAYVGAHGGAPSGPAPRAWETRRADGLNRSYRPSSGEMRLRFEPRVQKVNDRPTVGMTTRRPPLAYSSPGLVLPR
jgi:hypothetical protein